MIVQRWNMVCDVCAECFDSTEGYEHKDDLVADARESDWAIQENGATFCASCDQEERDLREEVGA